MFYYSSNPLKEQTVECLGQLYITLQTVQSLQYKFSGKVMSVRQTGQPKAEFSFLAFSFLAFFFSGAYSCFALSYFHVSHFQRRRCRKLAQSFVVHLSQFHSKTLQGSSFNVPISPKRICAPLKSADFVSTEFIRSFTHFLMVQQLHKNRAMTTSQNRDTMSKPGRKGR